MSTEEKAIEVQLSYLRAFRAQCDRAERAHVRAERYRLRAFAMLEALRRARAKLRYEITDRGNDEWNG